ncbi:hypothetical protein BAUCODRAFT_54700, partial [Baudoinia panamericana UAMH 10762]
LPPNAGALASNGDVTASDNVMNRVADASKSLFQICVTLRQRLLAVPGFADSLMMEEDEADDDTDPVTVLWRTFRRGVPLMELYNALEPEKRLMLGNGIRDDKKGKAATFKFLQACVNELKFPQEECFIVTDLYGDDTTGFVKVAKVVNRVLDIMVQRGLVDDIRSPAQDLEQAEQGMKRTHRQNIINELVTTERTYVQHLELLQAFKHLIEEKGVIPGDAIHDIFLNLNSLLDFQRRFLIRVEQTNALPEDEQNWGNLFVLYCEAFKVYEPYIANQHKCRKTVEAEFPKLKEAGGSMEMRQMVESYTQLYSGFLMKPFQRLTKYPDLLEQLYKKGDLDEDRRQDLLLGKEAAQSILTRTNKALDREEKAEAVQELRMRVEDWKGHQVSGFGELLLYGTFTVLKSENLASGKDGERQYHVYLFETILLCCKDIDPSKPKNKLSGKPMVDKRGKPKLQLKGRIFMQNVTDLVSLAKPGSYTCQIFWKGDPSIENFIIRFATEETMKKWAQQIEAQRRRFRGDGGGTSATEFVYMQSQPAIENPYARMAREEEEDEEEEEGQGERDDDVETLVASRAGSWETGGATMFSQSRNGSQSSLRSRSTTGESAMSASGSMQQGRAPPPRFAPGSLQQPLSLRTQQLPHGTNSPMSGILPVGAESYFSPTGESPMQSARTSGSSGMYPFPRQAAGSSLYEEERQGQQQQQQSNARFTAPAVGRSQQSPSPSSISSSTAPSAVSAARQGRPGAGMHSAQQMPLQPRNRSASSPDIHNHNGQQRLPHQPQPTVSGTALRATTNGAGGQPPVPDVPYHHYAGGLGVGGGAPRSHSNSPQLVPGPRGPTMTNSSSPQQRERTFPGSVRYQMDPSPTSSLGYGGGYHHQTTANSSRTTTPAPASGSSTSASGPTQLKVKVHCPTASQVLTLVVSTNITYQTLKDRIDAKLQRSTNLRLSDGGGGGTPVSVSRENLVKLKYADEGDFVSIQSDEDVQTAFEAWQEGGGGGGSGSGSGGMGEIELWCQR